MRAVFFIVVGAMVGFVLAPFVAFYFLQPFIPYLGLTRADVPNPAAEWVGYAVFLVHMALGGCLGYWLPRWIRDPPDRNEPG
jgi:hypothetical protein